MTVNDSSATVVRLELVVHPDALSVHPEDQVILLSWTPYVTETWPAAAVGRGDRVPVGDKAELPKMPVNQTTP